MSKQTGEPGSVVMAIRFICAFSSNQDGQKSLGFLAVEYCTLWACRHTAGEGVKYADLLKKAGEVSHSLSSQTQLWGQGRAYVDTIV